MHSHTTTMGVHIASSAKHTSLLIAWENNHNPHHVCNPMKNLSQALSRLSPLAASPKTRVKDMIIVSVLSMVCLATLPIIKMIQAESWLKNTVLKTSGSLAVEVLRPFLVSISFLMVVTIFALLKVRSTVLQLVNYKEISGQS